MTGSDSYRELLHQDDSGKSYSEGEFDHYDEEAEEGASYVSTREASQTADSPGDEVMLFEREAEYKPLRFE